MNAPLSILLNKTILYNKKTAIIFFVSLYLVVFVTFFDKGLNTSFGNLFLIFTLYINISICLIKLIKENNYMFHKFSFNTDEYKFSSRKEKMICYTESFNRLSKNNIQARDLGYDENETINKFLINFNNSFINELMKSITFERFNDFMINTECNKTTSQLFSKQYRNSLLKIIKDFIINTDYLKNASVKIKQQFIHELTNHNNLNFDSTKGLHYDDKFVIDFLEKNNNQKTIIQENVTTYENEQLKIENISIFRFYRVISISIEEICKTKLNRKEKEELKSIIGFYFKSSKSEDILKFKKDLRNISFTNSKISKKLILILKYLTEIHHIENQESKLSRILTLSINEKSFPRKVKNRTDSIRKCYRNNNLSKSEKTKVNHILQEFLNNKT